MKVGVIGCGNISEIYFSNLRDMFSDYAQIVMCGDLDATKVAAKVERYCVRGSTNADDVLTDAQVDCVLNLTTPPFHYNVCKRAMLAGKHVYVEKPLSILRDEGRELVELAKERGLQICCAPDTFLGGGLQTCIEIVQSGAIGRIVGLAGFMMSSGHESWHPDPAFYYKRGAGPLFDMGPYYLTAFIALAGGIRRVCGSAVKSFPTRLITSQPRNGQVIEVEVPTHINAVLEFENGAAGTLTTTFDVCASRLPNIELYGSEGTLAVPDPNTFGGPVLLRKRGEEEWTEIPITKPYAANARGVGLADMALAIAQKREPLASGALALHVLDVMHAIHEAAASGQYVTPESVCARPAILQL